MMSTNNKTTSEKANNQILYAGFELIEKSDEMVLTKSCLFNNMIIFILDGSIKLYSEHKNVTKIGYHRMVFLKRYDKYTYEVTSATKILIFTFDSLPIDEFIYIETQFKLIPDSAFDWIVLEMSEPLITFLELVIHYKKRNYTNIKLYLSKREELFYLLKMNYSKEELGNFFHLLITTSTNFERKVAMNCMKAKNVKELASLMGYGLNTFRTKFKNIFGMPAYQWLLCEKAKQVLKSLTKGDDLKDIIDEFGFTSHSHFYKFCKTQFGLIPEELKKRINQ